MTDYERIDYRNEEGSSWLAVTFLLIGLGAGALLGLLYAPKTGRQMRRTLRRRYEDVRDRIDDLSGQAGDVIGKGAEWASNAKERVAPLGKAFRR